MVKNLVLMTHITTEADEAAIARFGVGRTFMIHLMSGEEISDNRNLEGTKNMKFFFEKASIMQYKNLPGSFNNYQDVLNHK